MKMIEKHKTNPSLVVHEVENRLNKTEWTEEVWEMLQRKKM